MEKKLFDELINSMEEIVAIENGQIQPVAVMVRSSVDLIRIWEQKRRIPSGIALNMLCLIEREPALINTLRGIQV